MQCHVPPIGNDRIRRPIPRSLPIPGHVVPRHMTIWIVGALIELTNRPERQVLYNLTVGRVRQEVRLFWRRFSVGFFWKVKDLPKVFSYTNDKEPFSSLRHPIFSSVA